MRGSSMLLALGLGFGVACGSAAPLSGDATSDAEPECPIGEETCPCSSSGACIPGLACESNICVGPGGSGSSSGSTDGDDSTSSSEGASTSSEGSSTAPSDGSSSSSGDGDASTSSSSDDGAESSSDSGSSSTT